MRTLSPHPIPAVLTAIGIVLIAAGRSSAHETSSTRPSDKIDFARDVYAVLEQHCIGCHGPDSQEGRLRLDARNLAFAGGVSGVPIAAGHSDRSLLIERVEGGGDEPRMPLDADPLSTEQIALLKRWIDAGADWPGGVGPDLPAPKPHWAYVKPVRPAPPEIADVDRGELANSIDAFIVGKVRERGLEPSPIASKESLIRRATFDLTGLPPSIDELDEFLADDAPDAYARLVDRLLSSPHYGERWAVPWLDAARFADSNGYQRDGRREAWPYRDWVIRALNDDLPFDRFTIEQMAGDLLPDATEDQIVATGFHRASMVNVEAGTDPNEEHVHAVVDRVNTTATVWLGSTIECAQCHSHKYDPFSQREYYRLYAYFNNTLGEIESRGSERDLTGPLLTLNLPSDAQGKFEAAKANVQQVEQQQAGLRAELLKSQPEWEQEVAATGGSEFPATLRELIATPREARSEEETEEIENSYLSRRPEWKQMAKDMARVKTALEKVAPPTTLVMQELSEPRMTRVFKRGDFLSPGQTVAPGTPAALHPLDAHLPANRLGLATWLVSPDNPLTARVAINRHWAELFGRGLVVTPEDFGTQGAAPTHPELLDWLATEFIRQEWSQKAMHRLLVESRAYQQSTITSPANRQRDPDNEWLARGPRSRLRAELVRDNALAVGGLLGEKFYGPPVFPYQPPGVWNHIGRASNVWETSQGLDFHRRGVYVYWRRTVPYPSFVNFDAPSRESCTVQRSLSTTPLQALTLLNDPAYFEAAVGFAQRLLIELPAETDAMARVTYGFRLATSRSPNDAEQALLVARFEAELARYRAHPEQAAEMLRNHEQLVQMSSGALDPVVLAAWTHVASVLLNLDETIHKG